MICIFICTRSVKFGIHTDREKRLHILCDVCRGETKLFLYKTWSLIVESEEWLDLTVCSINTGDKNIELIPSNIKGTKVVKLLNTVWPCCVIITVPVSMCQCSVVWYCEGLNPCDNCLLCDNISACTNV